MMIKMMKIVCLIKRSFQVADCLADRNRPNRLSVQPLRRKMRPVLSLLLSNQYFQ